MRALTLRRAMVLAGIGTALWCAAAAPARATFGARTTADEPQYLLTALSLWEDGSLDIADELADERWRAFHEAPLPEQTKPLDGGRRLSPHDPLLPLVLAVPMGLGGWLAAKLTLALFAGGLAATLVWVAVRRLTVPATVATGTALAFSLAAPLVVYGTQVYPEVPAAVAVTLGIAAVTGPLTRGGRWLLAASVVVLPWLAVKYAPIAGALALVALVRLWRRGDRRPVLVLAGGLALAGGAYLAFHQAVYGGWTVYAAGDHFVGGELTVAGTDPNYLGRSERLLGLLVDRGFGLAAWAPAWLLAVPAIGALLRRRPAGWPTLVAVAGAGWLMATFVALTMHGFWWPGRQVVVVLPALVLAVAWWLAATRSRVGRLVLGVGAAAGIVTWGWLLVEVLRERLTVVIAFEATRNPIYLAWRLLLPDYRELTAAGWVRHGAWIGGVLVLAVVGWRSAAFKVPSITNEENARDDHAIGSVGGRGRSGGRVLAGRGGMR
ncbi:MAG: hypothetical protein ACRD29_15575 [Acidimicrobiales bacterium]